MNFKKISIAVSLALAAGASFASDIDLSTGTELTGADVATFAFDMLAGSGADSNNAVIFQDITAAKAIAFVDQVGTTASIAVISQSGSNDSVAFIQQNGTTGAVAVIFQH
jgi:hypothetical protein